MSVVDEMLDDEPEVDLTPMIDVTFLLLIFFMCMRFKSYEKKLPSDLPLDQGLFASPPKPIQQLRFDIRLVAGTTDQVNIIPDPRFDPFRLVAITDKTATDEKLKKAAFSQITDMINKGWKMVGDKIEIAPQPDVPFEFVALTLDAVHKSMEGKPDDQKKKIAFKAAPPEGRPE